MMSDYVIAGKGEEIGIATLILIGPEIEFVE